MKKSTSGKSTPASQENILEFVAHLTRQLCFQSYRIRLDDLHNLKKKIRDEFPKVAQTHGRKIGKDHSLTLIFDEIERIESIIDNFSMALMKKEEQLSIDQ